MQSAYDTNRGEVHKQIKQSLQHSKRLTIVSTLHSLSVCHIYTKPRWLSRQIAIIFATGGRNAPKLASRLVRAIQILNAGVDNTNLGGKAKPQVINYRSFAN